MWRGLRGGRISALPPCCHSLSEVGVLGEGKQFIEQICRPGRDKPCCGLDRKEWTLQVSGLLSSIVTRPDGLVWGWKCVRRGQDGVEAQEPCSGWRRRTGVSSG